MIYLIHGLFFSSNVKLSLPEMAHAPHIDVNIELKKIDSSSLDTHSNSTDEVFFKAINNQNILVSLPDIAKFHIKDGKTIIIDPSKESLKNWPSVELYLFGSIIGVILTQRSLFAFHSNAVLINNKGVLIAGDSGAGKSTTAAIFQQQGYYVLCDDIVVVNEDLHINGDFPKIKLWKDSLEKLNIYNSNLEPVATQEGKFHYPLTHKNNNHSSKIEICAFYILSTSTRVNTIEIEQVKGVNQFQVLLSNTYRSELVSGLGIQKYHMDICSQLARKIPIIRIQRPVQPFSGYDIVDRIIHDLDDKNHH